MSTINGYADQVLTYAVGLYAMTASHGTDIMGLLGFVLISAKLIQEVPRAWRTVFHDKGK